MRILVGSDEDTALARHIIQDLTRRGHVVTASSAISVQPRPWSSVGREVATAVAQGAADMGVCLCWTGTGVSMAANRVPGARAALCADAQTAAGARRWNDANVLVLSNRMTSLPVAEEILDAWFTAEVDPDESENIADLDAQQEGHSSGRA